MAYEKQTWQTGDVITQEKLNHMEDGIENAYELPAVTETDNGKVLGVEDGQFKLVEGGSGGGVATEMSAIYPAYAGWDNGINKNVQLSSVSTGNGQWYPYFVVSENNSLNVDDVVFVNYRPAHSAPTFVSKVKATSGSHLWFSNTIGADINMSVLMFTIVNYNNSIVCILHEHSDTSAEDAVQKGYEALTSTRYDIPYFAGIIKKEFFQTA